MAKWELFSEERMFEDLFFSVGQTNSRELWLRSRRNLSSGEAPTLMLSETWEGAFESCLRLKEYRGDAEIRRRLDMLKIAHSTTALLEKHFPLRAKFRFYRITCSNAGTIVNLDETLFGITLNFKVAKKSQFEHVCRETGGMRKADSKLAKELTCTVYSGHICGSRRDELEGCDDADDGREWQDVLEQAHAQTEHFVPTANASFYSRGSDDFGAVMRDRLLGHK